MDRRYMYGACAHGAPAPGGGRVGGRWGMGSTERDSSRRGLDLDALLRSLPPCPPPPYARRRPNPPTAADLHPATAGPATPFPPPPHPTTPSHQSTRPAGFAVRGPLLSNAYRRGPGAVRAGVVCGGAEWIQSAGACCVASPHLTSPHLTSPYLTSPHLTSPYLTSPCAVDDLKRRSLTSPKRKGCGCTSTARLARRPC